MLSTTTNGRITLGSRSNGVTPAENMMGGMDELIIWNSTLAVATILKHSKGDFSTEPRTLGGGCLTWYNFNDSTTASTAADSCGDNDLTWQSSQGWPTTTTLSSCVAGFFSGWKLSIETLAAITRIRQNATVRIDQLDQYGGLLSLSPIVPTTTSITLKLFGWTGDGNPIPNNIVVSIVAGVGRYVLTSSTPQEMIFSLIDSAKTGRSVDNAFALLTFLAPAVTAVSFADQAGTPLTYSPVWDGFVMAYSMSVLPTVLTMTVTVTHTSTTLTGSSLKLGPVALASGQVSGGFSISNPETITFISIELGMSFAYTFNIVQLPTDISNITLTADSPLKALAPFVPGTTSNVSVEVEGQLIALNIVLTCLTPGVISLTLNDQQVDLTLLASGVPFSLTASLLAAQTFRAQPGVDVLKIQSANEIVTHTYSFSIATCPMPYTCQVGTGVCQNQCYYCIGDLYRSVCLTGVPDCCASPECPC